VYYAFIGVITAYIIHISTADFAVISIRSKTEE
jgi:hypothetical protein